MAHINLCGEKKKFKKKKKQCLHTIGKSLNSFMMHSPRKLFNMHTLSKDH